jgi:hypothetical protein
MSAHSVIIIVEPIEVNQLLSGEWGVGSGEREYTDGGIFEALIVRTLFIVHRLSFVVHLSLRNGASPAMTNEPRTINDEQRTMKALQNFA